MAHLSSPSGRLTLRGLAWRHLKHDQVSTVALLLAFFLGVGFSIATPVIAETTAAAGLDTALAATDGLSIETQVTDHAGFGNFQAQARRAVTGTMGSAVDGGAEQASAGPLHVASVNGQTASTAVAKTPFGTGYRSDLASQVRLVQGELPAAVTGGQVGAVSVSQTVASESGLHLGDVVCVGGSTSAASSAPTWCARIVGIWEQRNAGASYWSAGASQPWLFTDSNDFFAMVGALGTGKVAASRHYTPRTEAIAAGDAAAVAGHVGELRDSVHRQGIGTLRTTLDGQLSQYATARAGAALRIQVLSAALAILAILAIGVVGRHFLEQRAPDLAVLRARGWSTRRVLRLVLMELGAIVALGAGAAGLAGAAALLILAEFGRGPAQAALAGGELAQTITTAAITLVGGAAWLLVLSNRVASARILRLELPALNLLRGAVGRRMYAGGLLSVPAVLAPLALSVPQVQRVGGYLLSLAALALLMLAAPRLMMPAVWLLGRLSPDVEATLARWRLRRWRYDHGGTGVLLMFAVALATYAAIGIVAPFVDGGGKDTLLRGGLVATLALAFAGSVLAALAAHGLVFLFTFRTRSSAHLALLLDGLSVRALRRSLAIEQNLVLGTSLLAGVVIGLGLALTATQPGTLSPAAALAGAGFSVALVALVSVIAGSVVRRTSARGPRAGALGRPR